MDILSLLQPVIPNRANRPPGVARTVAMIVVVLLIFQVAVLTAQSTDRWVQLTEFQDSLARVTDTSGLRALRKNHRGDLLRSGLIALRLGDLHADSDFSQARKDFRRATKLEPRLAEAWYGWGLAEEGRSRGEMGNPLRLGSRVGLGTLEGAGLNYSRALEANPKFIPAALALARVELSLLDTTRLKKARDLLRLTSAALRPTPPELLLAWGQVERFAGSLPAAAVAFERYLATGGNRARGLLELARTRLAMGLSSGDPPYYEGASLEDPEAVAGYRADLKLIAADSNLVEFDRLKGTARSAFLHRFWTDRDHLELRSEGERLREHYRRLHFARRNFPLTISRRFYGRYDAYRSGNTEVDDRGIIYIRQGEPSERLRPFIFRAMPNESWRYVRGDGDLLFHFSAGYDSNGGGDLYDYRLVESVFDLHGAADAPIDQLILSRQSLSPIYSRILNWGAYGSASEQARERNIGAVSIAVGTTTDSHELRFERRLGAVADLIAVGRHPQGGLTHFVFGIASAGTVWRWGASGVEYPVRVRLVALDRHDRAVARLDTSLVIQLERPLTKAEFLVGRAELGIPAGRWSYRAALQQGDSGGVILPRGSVLVAHSGATSLALSDIALGSPRRAVRWVTDAADTVLLAPSALFRKAADVQVYYELSGAQPGVLYRHEITILADGRRAESRPLVALSFDEEATSSVVRSRRTVQLDRLKKGDYLVEVRITAPNGESQVRRRSLKLIDR